MPAGVAGGAVTSSTSSSVSSSQQQSLRKHRVDADPVIFVSPPTKNNVYRDAHVAAAGYSLRDFLSQIYMAPLGNWKK